MIYLYYAGLAYSALTLCGLGAAWLILPRPLLKYSLAFAPLFGFTYLLTLVYYLYRLDVAGTDRYAFALLVPPVLLLGGQLLDRYGGAPSKREAMNRDVWLAIACGAVAFVAISIPWFVRGLTTMSLGNLDAPELAVNARFLKEFARSSQTGFMGQTGFFAWTADQGWFGPSAIAAALCSLLGVQPYQFQSLVSTGAFGLSIPLVFILAREVLEFDAKQSVAMALLYGCNPVIYWLVYQSFGGQVCATTLLLGLTILHMHSGTPESTGEAVRRVLSMAALFGALLLSYHFMLLITLLFLGTYSLSRGVLSGRTTANLRDAVLLGLASVAAMAVNPQRTEAMFLNLLRLGTGDMGFFVPWISPDVLLGLNTSDYLTGAAVSAYRWIPRALAGVVLVFGSLGLIRTRHTTNRLAFVLGFAVPITLVGLVLAVQGAQEGTLGGYKGLKITATFAAANLAALLIAASAGAWWAQLRFWAAALVVALLSVPTTTDLVTRMRDQGAFVSQSLIDIQQVESFPFVSDVNVLVDDDWSLFWKHYFLLKKRQFFQHFPYGGRIGGTSPTGYYLSGPPARVDPDEPESRADLFRVSAATGRNRIAINGLYTVFQSSTVFGLDIQTDRGWFEPEPTHRWSGKDGRLSSIIVTAPDDLTANITATFYLPLPDAEHITVRVNGEPARTNGDTHQMQVESFHLRKGRNVVEFETTLPPSTPTTRDPRTLGVAWQSIVVSPMDR